LIGRGINVSNIMKKKNTLEALLDKKQEQKSIFYQWADKLFYYFWLYFMVRKKSHRTRIIKAMRLFHLLKKPEFKTQPGRLFAYIKTIDPFVFEELLLIAFQSRGLKVIRNKRYTGDGGIDGIVLLPSKIRMAIQAKRYQNHINAQHLIDFAAVLTNHRCSGGYFIHCGKSGQTVYQQIPQNITLISGATLHRLLVEG
jgi:restriction system protein